MLVIGVISGLVAGFLDLGIIASIMPKSPIRAKITVIEKETGYYRIYEGEVSNGNINTDYIELEIVNAERTNAK